MSIHSTIRSNITDFESLKGVLAEAGIAWHPIEMFFKENAAPVFIAIEARIGNDQVWISQDAPGKPFDFQSPGWNFRNRRDVKAVAIVTSAEELRQRREAQMSEREEEKQREVQRQNAQQRWQEEENQRRIEEERREQETRRRIEAERLAQNKMQQRHVEKQPQVGESRHQPIEPEKARQDTAAEAARLLAQLDAEASMARATRSAANSSAPRPLAPERTDQPQTPVDSQAIEGLVGRLHQQNAERKVMQKVDEIKQAYGISLQSAETLEDGARLLVLRG